MREIFLKPNKPGAMVRFPNQMERLLPAEGEKVIDSTYWQRRIRGGDVVVIEAKKKSLITGGKNDNS